MARKITQSTLEERKIVILNYLDGKSQREIANIVKKSKSTVHDIIKRYKEENRISNKQHSGAKKSLQPEKKSF